MEERKSYAEIIFVIIPLIFVRRYSTNGKKCHNIIQPYPTGTAEGEYKRRQRNEILWRLPCVLDAKVSNYASHNTFIFFSSIKIRDIIITGHNPIRTGGCHLRLY
jgi:hypothetical protein